jgi:hypothetical protein
VDREERRLREALARAWAGAGEDGDVLAALAATRDLRALLYDWEAHLARAASEAGHSWDEIGKTLGVSRQAAWTRFRQPPGGAAIREARERLEQARKRLEPS